MRRHLLILNVDSAVEDRAVKVPQKGRRTMDMTTNMSAMASAMQACINACAKCSQDCYMCFNACLHEPDLNMRKDCVKMLIECGNMCEISAAMMSMKGRFSQEHCQLCALICDTCAKECDMYKEEHCQRCVASCRKCADECRNMAAM